MKITSTREEAERIAKMYTREGTGYADRLYRLAYAIDHALQARDERAAKIAEQDSIISWAGGSTGDAKGTALRIARAIRSNDAK